MFAFFSFAFGFFIVVMTLVSAIRTFVLPRAASDFLSDLVFRTNRKIVDLISGRLKSYEQKDRLMALYAPVSLLMFPPLWLTLITFGYTFMFWAVEIGGWEEAFTAAGSSILTLGFAKGELLVHTILSFSGASLGLILVALLIAYLPTMYTAFSRREVMVNQLSVRAGARPSPVVMLMRFHRLDLLGQMSELWVKWEDWFTEVEESHTSLAALVFFRSPQPEQSWVNAAGAVMDAAALRLALLDLKEDVRGTLTSGQAVPGDPAAAIAIRAGFIALRRIADFFQVSYNPHSRYPEDPISVSRADFEECIRRFREQGIPLKGDLDQAWRDYAGWRVNYDSVLTALQELTFAPPSTWFPDSPEF